MATERLTDLHLEEGEGLSKEQLGKAAMLKRNVVELEAQANRLRDRAKQTPPGPKQTQLLKQEADKRKEILHDEGWNEAIDSLSAIMFIVNQDEASRDRLFAAARKAKGNYDGETDFVR